MIKRIIPVFLLKGNRLVKGTQFKDHKDVGDPVSQAMIYDAQGADEIVLVDITASLENRLIDTNIITNIIKECRLPLAVGGGIKNIEDARKVFNAGADKIIVNTHISLGLIKKLANEFGSQSVMVSIDVSNEVYKNDIFVKSGTLVIDVDLIDYIENVIFYGAGEILLTSIDKEGTLSGFDIELYKQIRDICTVPLIASGGAGCYDHIVKLFKETDVDACGIGRMLCLRDYDIVRIKAYLKGKGVDVRDA